MAQLNNMAIQILIVIAVAAAILQAAEAADYTVGGSTGWTNSPPGGASFYSNWASNITFRVNDTLVFDFVAGAHTVAELTKANYDSCNVNQNIQLITTSPARVTLNHTGEFYFACSIGRHCNAGQKLSVNVAGSLPTPTPGTAPPPAQPPPSGTSPTPTPTSNTGPSPQSPPTEPGDTPPPPPPPSRDSASSLGATFSLLIAVAINLMF